MATATFERALTLVLAHEGGFANHPADPGGATNRGVTQRVYDSYRHAKGQATRNVRAITTFEVREIYRRQYWNVVRGDDLPAGLDLATFDPAVNSGPTRAAKWLQAALGVAQDGAVGPLTLAAAVRAPDKVIIIKKLCARRLGFLQALATWTTFGKGWTRRVAAVEATAIAWAAKAAGRSPEDALAQEAEAAEAARRKAAGGAAASGTGGGAAATQIDPSQAEHAAMWIIVALTVAVAGVAGWLAWRAHVERQRADALRALATKQKG